MRTLGGRPSPLGPGSWVSLAIPQRPGLLPALRGSAHSGPWRGPQPGAGGFPRVAAGDPMGCFPAQREPPPSSLEGVRSEGLSSSGPLTPRGARTSPRLQPHSSSEAHSCPRLRTPSCVGHRMTGPPIWGPSPGPPLPVPGLRRPLTTASGGPCKGCPKPARRPQPCPLVVVGGGGPSLRWPPAVAWTPSLLKPPGPRAGSLR